MSGARAITRAEVEAAQRAWGAGVVAIGQAFTDRGDYRARAAEHLRTLYGFDLGEVLFKPTLAADTQFRGTFDDALSYFVGGRIFEDQGFALRPWTRVRFGEQRLALLGETALAMGNYYFTPRGLDEETKVEFSFGYRRDDAGQLRIVLHHSSLPYQPG